MFENIILNIKILEIIFILNMFFIIQMNII